MKSVITAIAVVFVLLGFGAYLADSVIGEPQENPLEAYGVFEEGDEELIAIDPRMVTAIKFANNKPHGPRLIIAHSGRTDVLEFAADEDAKKFGRLLAEASGYTVIEVDRTRDIPVPMLREQLNQIESNTVFGSDDVCPSGTTFGEDQCDLGTCCCVADDSSTKTACALQSPTI